MLHILGAPDRWKPRAEKEKKSKAEKVMEKAVASFMKYQEEMNEQF